MVKYVDMGREPEQGVRRFVNVNGRQYFLSLTDDSGWCYIHPGDFSQFEFDLGRDYRVFTATIGLTDTSDSDTTVRFEVIGDSPTPLYTKKLSFGQSYPIKVDVTNVLRLKLRVTSIVDEDICDSGRQNFAAWASPYVSANPFLVPERPVD